VFSKGVVDKGGARDGAAHSPHVLNETGLMGGLEGRSGRARSGGKGLEMLLESNQSGQRPTDTSRRSQEFMHGTSDLRINIATIRISVNKVINLKYSVPMYQ
jgi:hypothetical protein